MDGFTRLLCTLVLAAAVVVPVAPWTATAFEYQTDLLNFGRFGYSDGSSAEFPVTGFQYDVRNFRYKDASGKWKHIDEADARYGGAADADAQCKDTNWRRVSDSPGWMRNVRDQTRGKFGGLTIPGDTGVTGAWDWWPSLTDVSRASSYFPYVGTIKEDGVVSGCAWNKFTSRLTFTQKKDMVVDHILLCL